MIGFTPVAKKMLRLAEQFILFWCCLEKDASFEGTTNLYRPSFLIYFFSSRRKINLPGWRMVSEKRTNLFAPEI
jgi:hypothetical protein